MVTAPRELRLKKINNLVGLTVVSGEVTALAHICLAQTLAVNLDDEVQVLRRSI